MGSLVFIRISECTVVHKNWTGGEEKCTVRGLHNIWFLLYTKRYGIIMNDPSTIYYLIKTVFVTDVLIQILVNFSNI